MNGPVGNIWDRWAALARILSLAARAVRLSARNATASQRENAAPPIFPSAIIPGGQPVFFPSGKALYRAEKTGPSTPGIALPWLCRCGRCGHEQWIVPGQFKYTYRAKCT